MAATITPLLLRIEVIKVAGMATLIFFLAAANGIPQLWNSAYPAFIISATLLTLQFAAGRRPFDVQVQWSGPGLAFLLWIVSACASSIANPRVESLTTLFYAYLIPGCIFLSLSLRRLAKHEHVALLGCLSAGALVPSISGIVAYYRTWGIPSLPELAVNRYDAVLMLPYQMATFGNVGHMAAYACLISPPVLAGALTKGIPPISRVLCGACYAALALNILIAHSRAGILVFLLFTAIVLLAFGRFRMILIGVTALTMFLYQEIRTEGWEQYKERLFFAVTVDTYADRSVAERSDSIEHSWSMFLRNPVLGVGPGLSREGNPFAVAHQLFVHQAAELGFLGLVSCVVLTIGIALRFMRATAAFYASRRHWAEMVWLSGALGWLTYSSIAGATLNITFVIPWIGLFAAFLALSRAYMD